MNHFTTPQSYIVTLWRGLQPQVENHWIKPPNEVIKTSSILTNYNRKMLLTHG